MSAVNVFFEESGSFKAGSVLSRQGDAFQVELPGGRRAKVRAKDVLIEFDAPGAAELMQQAEAAAREIDPGFLWECAPPDEFAFTALAGEYFGAAAGPVERAALALRLHGAPVYFRRKGRGQYQRAPAEQLQMALAALERKRQQALVQAQYEEELKAGQLPAAFSGKVTGLLTKPDKNAIEYRALEAAAAARGVSMPRLMLECGGIASARALHEARFLAEFFPHGTGFPAVALGALPDDLPAAHVQAFSIDDITTTEIDDAFSVEHLADGRVRIGIHIAAPALGIARGDAVDAIVRARLSTVYMPGGKITMLPDDFVAAFTLQEGGLRFALSLYAIVNRQTQEIVATETRAERVFIAHNLRTNTLDELVTEDALATGAGVYPHKDDIAVLWPFAQALFEKRQQMRASYGLKREVQRNTDYSFYVDGERVAIVPRRRGSPLDLIVAELAILANSTWGAVLHDHGVPGIYRVQRAFGTFGMSGPPGSGPKRTRMQTNAAPHEGLGVTQYAWSTSPLRRYVDLVNQWQLLACAQHGVAAKLVAPFKPRDADLFAIVQGFDDTYTAYADYQQRMEYFWCLRWLAQENHREVAATVIKDDLVRLEDVPLLLHVPALGVHARGTRVLLEIVSIDELTIEAPARLLRVLDAPDAARAAEADIAGIVNEADDKAEGAVENAMDDKAEGAVENAMDDEAENAVENAAEDAVENAVGNETEDTVDNADTTAEPGNGAISEAKPAVVTANPEDAGRDAAPAIAGAHGSSAQLKRDSGSDAAPAITSAHSLSAQLKRDSDSDAAPAIAGAHGLSAQLKWGAGSDAAPTVAGANGGETPVAAVMDDGNIAPREAQARTGSPDLPDSPDEGHTAMQRTPHGTAENDAPHETRHAFAVPNPAPANDAARTTDNGTNNDANSSANNGAGSSASTNANNSASSGVNEAAASTTTPTTTTGPTDSRDAPPAHRTMPATPVTLAAPTTQAPAQAPE